MSRSQTTIILVSGIAFTYNSISWNCGVCFISDVNFREVADLFVMKRFRRHGIARKVVQHFMGQRVEPWTVVVFDEATEAQLFWQSMFIDPQFKPDLQVADPDDRAVKVYVLEPNVAAGMPNSQNASSELDV